MNKEDIVYRHNVNGYVYVYDRYGFIHVYDNNNIEDPTVQCIKSVKCTCSSKKDFDLEVLYIHSSEKYKNINLDEDIS
jgi:hypothetical protein